MTSESLNPFQPPRAEPEEQAGPVGSGSLEQALAGRYDFGIEEVLREAWALNDGFKASFWGGAVVVYVLLFGATMVGQFVAKWLFGEKPHFVVMMVFNALVAALLAPLTMGLIMLAVKRAAGEQVSFEVAFSCVNKAKQAILAGVLVVLLTYLGYALLIVPGIYSSLAYGMTMPLIADRNLAPWQAMETSRRALTHKWGRIFGLYLSVALLVGVSALLCGVPVIWTMPWAMLVHGVLYRRIFGVVGTAATAVSV